MIRAICGRIFGCAHRGDAMSAEEAFYRRTLWMMPAKFTPSTTVVTPEIRADIEKYLHLKPGSESDDVIRDIYDSGL